MQAVLRISSDPVEVIRDRMKMTKHIEITGVKKENMETAFRTLMRTVRQTVDSSIARQCRLASSRPFIFGISISTKSKSKLLPLSIVRAR